MWGSLQHRKKMADKERPTLLILSSSVNCGCPTRPAQKGSWSARAGTLHERKGKAVNWMATRTNQTTPEPRLGPRPFPGDLTARGLHETMKFCAGRVQSDVSRIQDRQRVARLSVYIVPCLFHTSDFVPKRVGRVERERRDETI